MKISNDPSISFAEIAMTHVFFYNCLIKLFYITLKSLFVCLRASLLLTSQLAVRRKKHLN